MTVGPMSDIEHAHKVVFKLEFPERIEPPTKAGFRKCNFTSKMGAFDWPDIRNQ